MTSQLQIDWTQTIHTRENNPESESHLKANQYKFIGQCAYVLSLLQKGIVLTVFNAVQDYKITSLPRRILDLTSKGVPVQKRWVMVEGKRSHVEYYLNQNS